MSFPFVVALCFGHTAKLWWAPPSLLLHDDGAVVRVARPADVVTDDALPFAAPVERAVVVGPLFVCGSHAGRSASCITPRRTVQALETRWPIEHFGAAQRWVAQRRRWVLCASGGDEHACWQADGEALRRVEVHSADAAAIARGFPVGVATLWKDTMPAFSLADVVQTVSIESPEAHEPPVLCARFIDERLRCFGSGAWGELGDGERSWRWRVSLPLGRLRVADVTSLAGAACAALVDGRVFCWGRLPSRPGRPVHRVPACELDRPASAKAFAQARAEDLQRLRTCQRECRHVIGFDACHGCEPLCTPVPSLFRHDRWCREPVVEPHGACVGEAELPVWPTDEALREATEGLEVVLRPVFVATPPAGSVALVPGPRLCTLSTDGTPRCDEL